MSFVNAFFNSALDGGAAVALRASLHTALPNSSGSNEVTGGAYSRQTVTWAPASGGSVQSAAPVTWNVPALGATNVTHVGLWTPAGVWLGSLALSAAQPFPTSGTMTANPLTITLSN